MDSYGWQSSGMADLRKQVHNNDKTQNIVSFCCIIGYEKFKRCQERFRNVLFIEVLCS